MKLRRAGSWMEAGSWLVRPGAPMAILLFPASARAHDFGKGSGIYEGFLEGVAATFETLPAVLLLASAGIFAAIWQVRGFPRLWPGLIAGAIAGLALAAILPEPVLPDTVLLAVTLLVALAGASALAPGSAVAKVILAVCGGAGGFAVLGGHGDQYVPPAVWAGVMASLALFPAMVAAAGSILQERFAGGWTRVSLRALSSWIAAIAIMVAAFTLRGTGA